VSAEAKVYGDGTEIRQHIDVEDEHPPSVVPKQSGPFSAQLTLTLEDGTEVQGWWDNNIKYFYQRGMEPRTKAVKSWRYQKWERPA
jgi:hypothetical protein